MSAEAQLTPRMAQYRRIKGELPADALAVFDCVVDEMMVAHSHAAMIGEIKAVLLSPRNEAPLLYSDGQYTTLADLGETA